MWKQFLTKLPKKSSASGKGDHGSGSSPGRNATGNGATIQRTTSCPGAGPARPVSSVKRMSSAVFPSSVVAGIEPLLSFKDVPNGEKQNLFVSKRQWLLPAVECLPSTSSGSSLPTTGLVRPAVARVKRRSQCLILHGPICILCMICY